MLKKILIASVSALVLCACNSITEEAPRRINFDRSSAVIIDVRTPEEFKAEHIEGARNIPIASLKENAAREFANKSQNIVVYCNRGINSKKAKGILEGEGYTNVTDAGSIRNLKLDFKSVKEGK